MTLGRCPPRRWWCSAEHPIQPVSARTCSRWCSGTPVARSSFGVSIRIITCLSALSQVERADLPPPPGDGHQAGVMVLTGYVPQAGGRSAPTSSASDFDCCQEREFFIDNLLVRIHFIIVMIRWTCLAPWGPAPTSSASDFDCYRGTSLIRNRPPPLGPPYDPRIVLL